MRREDKATLLVDAGPPVCEPRRQGPCDMVDELGGLGARAWSPPLPIVWRGADGAGVEKGGLQACHKTGERLLGIRCTSKRGPAQRLESFDFLVTLRAPLLVDGALGLWLALLSIDKDPAWRHTTIARSHDRIAIALCQSGHGRWLRLGQDLLDLGQGRRDAGDPLKAGIGQLVQMLGAREGPVGHKIGRAGRGVARRHVVADNLAARFAIAPIAPQGLQQQRDTGLVLYDSCQHPLVEVRAMIPTLAVGDVHALFVRSLIAVIPAIDMETRRIEMAARGPQPQTRGRRGGTEAVECRHAKVVEGIEGTPEGVSIAMAGLNAGGNEARERRMLEKMRNKGELLVDKAQPVEDHGFAGMAGGHHPHFRVLLRRLSNNLRDAEFFKHPRDQAQVI